MKIKDIFESSTTAGAIATGAPARIGKTQKRAGSLFKGKVTNKPFYEAEVNEEEIVEQDLILVPDQIIKKDKGFIPHEKDRRDHEVEMARSELFAAAKDAQRIYSMLKNRSEDEGLMGWQQSYITLASDYLNSVADSLEHQAHTNEMTGGVLAGGMSNFEEGVAEGSEILKAGTAVRVPHKGKMVPGKIIRYDSGKGGESPAYVVDIGEYESKIVPVHDVKQGVAEEKLDEKKDACYSKVKSRYKVWPSAYASGALSKCRKVGASNWGNKSKK